MTTTRRPRDPLPDWAESGRESTESLASQEQDDRALAQGTAELAPPPSKVDVPAIERTEPLEALAAAGFEDREERTKVDVHRSRRQARTGPARARSDGGEEDEGAALVGATLGSYRLVAQIGRGGMGYVYRAEHVHLGREVALKLLRSDYAKRKDAVARFFQEARTVNRVRHRNIVDVTDLVELEDGTTFIIMELLTGLSLNDWARRPMEVPRILAVLAQICEGLAAAHSVHVVHRDLKPDNIIIGRGEDGLDHVKLLDFGVAKLIHREDDKVAVETAAGSVVGTPAYMSPEQAGGSAIDGRSDIYSLGAIMYELFCGQPMFRGRSFGEFVRKHLTELPLPPRATPRGKRIDPRLEAIILRAIDKDPDRRYQDILELRDAMLSLAATLRSLESGSGTRRAPLHAPDPGASADDLRASAISGKISTNAPLPSVANAVSLAPSAGRLTGAPRAAPWYVWFVGGAVAVALGIGGAAWYALTRSSSTTAAAPARVAFEISLESRPSGAEVLELGSTAIVCRTPCALTLTPTRDAPRDVRHYVLRANGFTEAPLSVDLSGSQHRFLVELAAVPAPAAPSDAQEIEGEIEDLSPLPVEQRRRTRPTPASPSAPSSSDLPDIPDEPIAPARREPSTDLPIIDDPPKPAPRRDRRDPRINNTETIDPFRAPP